MKSSKGFEHLSKSAVSFRMVLKGYRKPLEIDDLWDLKEEHKTGKILGSLEKNMRAGIKNAQRKLEIRQRKRKLHSAAADQHMNGLSKAQSQDALVLVTTAAGRESGGLHFRSKCWAEWEGILHTGSTSPLQLRAFGGSCGNITVLYGGGGASAHIRSSILHNVGIGHLMLRSLSFEPCSP